MIKKNVKKLVIGIGAIIAISYLVLWGIASKPVPYSIRSDGTIIDDNYDSRCDTPGLTAAGHVCDDKKESNPKQVKYTPEQEENFRMQREKEGEFWRKQWENNK